MFNSREGLLEREKEIIHILNILLEEKLEFIIVGGYAVSTYKKRFSVDLDLVIQENALKKFEKILLKNKYSLSYDKKIALLYEERFKRFLRKIRELNVYIDLLINGLVSRTTDASWSFDYIKKYSHKRDLDNIRFLTPEKELLIAMKFHTGRLSDIRDIVALMPCDIKKLILHILKGDIKKIRNQIEKQKEFLQKPQFSDSFKGIFGIHVYKEENVKEAEELINNLLRKI